MEQQMRERALQIAAGITLLYLTVDILSLFSISIGSLLGPGHLGFIFTLPGFIACIGLLARQRWAWWLGLVGFTAIFPFGFIFGRPIASILAIGMIVLLLINYPRRPGASMK